MAPQYVSKFFPKMMSSLDYKASMIQVDVHNPPFPFAFIVSEKSIRITTFLGFIWSLDAFLLTSFHIASQQRVASDPVSRSTGTPRIFKRIVLVFALLGIHLSYIHFLRINSPKTLSLYTWIINTVKLLYYIHQHLSPSPRVNFHLSSPHDRILEPIIYLVVDYVAWISRVSPGRKHEGFDKQMISTSDDGY